MSENIKSNDEITDEESSVDVSVEELIASGELVDLSEESPSDVDSDIGEKEILYFSLCSVKNDSTPKKRVVENVLRYTNHDTSKAMCEEMLTNLNENRDNVPSDYKRKFSSYFMRILHGIVINDWSFYIFKSKRKLTEPELTKFLRTLPEKELLKGKIVLKKYKDDEKSPTNAK